MMVTLKHLYCGTLIWCFIFMLSLPASLSQNDPDIFRITPNPMEPRYLIQNIVITDTRYQDKIAQLLGLKTGQRVTAPQLKALESTLEQTGLFSQVTLTLRLQVKGYELLVTLKDYPVIQEIKFLNQPTVFPESTLLQTLQFQKNQPLNLSQLDQALRAIETRYHQAGYTLALVEKVLEPQALDQNTLQLRMHEGRIEAYKIAGNIKTQDQTILREMTLKPGALFQEALFKRDLARLYQRGYFKALSFNVLPGQKQPYDSILEITVTETETLDIGLDGTFNNRDGLIGGFHIQEDNFLGQGKGVRLQVYAGLDLFQLASGQLSQSQRAALGAFEFYDPWLANQPLGLKARIYAERFPLFLNESLFQRATGVSLSLNKQFTHTPFSGNLQGKIEQVEIRDFTGAPRSDLTLARRHSAMDQRFQFSSSLSYDTRDQILNPHQGHFATLQLAPIWGDGTYLNLQGHWRSFVSFFDEWIWAVDVQGGLLTGNIPAYAQFVANSSTAIRGWPENQGIFGHHYWLTSLETRFPIYNLVSGVVFGDLGQYLPGPLRAGTGVGLRFNTPLGLIRIDYGIRDFQNWTLNTLLDTGQLHFNIGHKF